MVVGRAWAVALILCGVACKTSTPGGDPGDAAPTIDADVTDAAPDACLPPAGTTTGKLIRVVYLVPSDRDADARYVANLEHAVSDTQLWLSSKMPGGTSYRVHDPPVEVTATPHPMAYYRDNVNGDNPDYYYWYNAVDDGLDLMGGTFDDPNNIWLFYLAADTTCGQVTGGIASIALFPENDLRGLVQDERVPPCGDEPDDYGRCRWVGGMLLILFQALGLPQPAACEDAEEATVCDTTWFTRGGFQMYPDAGFSDDQLGYLEDNPFVRAVGLPDCTLDCATPIEP